MSMDDIRSEAARLNIDLSSVDWNSVRVPPGQDFGIKSDDEDLNEEDSLEFDGGFGNVIIVDNLPVVAKEKFEKLERVVRKIYSQIGVIKENGLWMPVEEDTGKTRGYCFIEYNTSQEVELAKEKTNGYKLDRAHIFAVNMFDEIDKFMKVPDEWAPPEIKPYTPGENLQHWLTDEKGRDQFVMRAGSDTEVLWNDARQVKADPVYKRPFWTESFVQWSPLGTYLATVHRQGAAVWGGASTFNRLMRYAHPQVKLIDFSPAEKYLVTYSSHEPSNPRDTHRVVLNIFDVRTGKVMRDFKGSADEFAISGTGGFAGVSWPVFRWGGGKEDKYFARMGKNVISVYETETFSLIDVPELNGGNQPARGFNGQLEFYNVDELETMATAEHFMATDIEWDPTGRYVATSVTSVHEMENGFNIWSFNGKLLYRILKDHFFQFLWRPRPPSFLSLEKEEEIAKNLKKYSKKYDVQDQDISVLLSEQDREKRKQLKDDWERWVNEWKKYHEEEKTARRSLRDGEDSDVEEEYEAKEVEVEEELYVKVEVIPDA
nr:eukaryotic translation initiation factor 3 subunit B-like [Tanacetum cinerariifolium]